MWRLGFKFWRAWVWLRVLIPTALLLWAVHRVYGAGTEFRIVALFLLGISLGTGFVLGDLARRELGGTLGRQVRGLRR